MIFVTVGTHEQQFNRLIEKIDFLRKGNIIQEEVIIQSGYCNYSPKYCKYSKLFSYEEMLEHMKNARIIISHGGPSTFIMALQIGKIPIVVPRQVDYNEHVNNHQLEFAKSIESRMRNIIVVDDIEKLQDVIKDYDIQVSKINLSNNSNNDMFCKKFNQIVKEVIEK